MSLGPDVAWAAPKSSPWLVARPAGRALVHTLADRLLVRRVTSIAQVPPRLGALTREWLTAALCGPEPTARVSDFDLEHVSSATSVRGRLTIHYDRDGHSLPRKLFAKSTPTVVTRLANGASATSMAEARFMMELRPLLGRELTIPWGHHCAADPRSYRSIQLLDDLVATDGARFGDVTLSIDRELAEDAIDLLADVHRGFALGSLPRWLRSYPDWWTMAARLANLRAATDRWVASDRAPQALGDPVRVWRAIERSIGLHDTLPTTLVHADVHLGNWYVTDERRMGLCDWQCVARGHWAIDVAYALTTLLSVEDRRAWEGPLLARYLERSGAPESIDEAWLRYRQQIPGALVKWTPTLHRPAGFPAMQPEVLAIELLDRVGTAMVDLDVLEALA